LKIIKKKDMSEIKKNVEKLNSMILEGKILEAFDHFYAEDVIMQDNDTEPRVGKMSCRKFEEDFVNNLTAFRGAEVKNIMVSEDAGVSVIEWDFDYSHREWGDRNYTQMAVQRWQNGKIISEKFIYN
jgi:hypothetical protein